MSISQGQAAKTPPSSPAPSAPEPRPAPSGARKSRVGRYRFAILAVLFVSTAINYLDRSVLSIVAPDISRDLGISPEMMGWLFSGFAWTYALAQIPGGRLVDRFGPRVVYACALVAWSAMTALGSLAKGFGFLFGTRLGLGLFEAPAFPCNGRIAASWFPRGERGRAVAVYTSGQFIGLGVAFPLIAWMAAALGWRHVFWVLGGVGIAWALIWMKVIRNRPAEHAKVGEPELEHILQGEPARSADEGGEITTAAADDKGAFKRDMKFLLRQRRIWGVFLGQFAIASTLYFFLTWFPTYLANERGLTLDKGGLSGALPFVAALVGVLCGGSWSDWMVKRGISANIARKAPIVTGLGLAGVIVAANYVTSNAAMIAIMCVAFFANGLASFSWVLVTEIAPERMLGVAGGCFNVFGNLAGIVVPVVIGYLVGGSGSFTLPLMLIAGITVGGALSFLFLVDKVERIEA
ncbi:MFS transporter [Streptomyces monticola]|uniref:MFS transporter n=1 Tax=Streptomyces monticola TaxID=2666263 RepID=A0ABW2JTN4_9ACTN